MTKDEAMKLALKALEAIGSQYVCRATHHTKAQQHHGYEACPNELTHEAAITALREALASEAIEQPAQRKPLPDGIPSPDELEALSDGNSGMIFNSGFPTKLDRLACWLREYAAIEAKLKEKNT